MSALVLAFNKLAADEFGRRLRARRGLERPTPEQQAVIDTTEGVIIVDARPGSGKTATLVSRTLELDPDCDERTAKTFHSWALREITRQPAAYGFTKRPTVVTGGLFSMLTEATGQEYTSWDESGWDQDLINLSERSLYTTELEAEIDAAKSDGDTVARRTLEALHAYRGWLLDESKVTFDAMVRLVAENPDYFDLPYDHVMVDEYQDVDRFQYDIIERMGALRPESLCVVGDPNQRIYEWRGALADSFTRLETKFTGSVRLPLSCNFRSRDAIIELGEAICPSGMYGVRGDTDGTVVTTLDPAEFWSRLTLDGPGSPPLRERAVLCRYNRTCAHWQLKLAKAGVPVYLVGKGDFWNMRHVKLVIEMRDKGEPWAAVEADRRWGRMKQSRIYQGEGGAARWDEVVRDAMWLHSLSKPDFELLQNCLQDENGIRVSTIHKAKGAEYVWVGIPEVDERLRRDTFVWYVGVSRARDQLTIEEIKSRREQEATINEEAGA